MKPAATAALGESLGSSSQFIPNEPRCPRTGEFLNRPAGASHPISTWARSASVTTYRFMPHSFAGEMNGPGPKGGTLAGQSVGRTFAASLNNKSRTARVAFS